MITLWSSDQYTQSTARGRKRQTVTGEMMQRGSISRDMVRRVVGAVVALFGVAVYGWHLAQQGSEPHVLWALIGGALIVGGLWLALPGGRRSTK